MKFVMDRAWEEAVGLLRGNAGLLAAIAGFLVFVPTVAIALLLSPNDVKMDEDATLEQALDILAAQFFDGGWTMIVSTILGGLASLAMVAMLRRERAPTVGQALSEAGRNLPVYLVAIAAEFALMAGLAFVLIILPLRLGSSGIAVLGMLAFLPILFYLIIKFSLVVPAIVIDGIRNPIDVLRRSWHLTKGNSFRLALFFILLGIAFVLIFSLISWIVSVLLALTSGEVETIGLALFEGATALVAAVVSAALIVSIHAQLRRLQEREPADAG